MDYILIDTDVFSYIFNGMDIQKYADKMKSAVPVLSIFSVGELFHGASKQGWGNRKLSRLEDQIRRYLIAPADEGLGRLWGELRTQAVRSGHPLGQASHSNDLWICATAIYYDAPLLTNNKRHFEDFPGLHLS
jgi:predicted nucleic acid-binding protein